MNITVLGSIMVDLVTRCEHYPVRGKTLFANSFACVPGGKGANQALAAAKMGANVNLIGAVGNDAMGLIALSLLEQAGVDTQGVLRLAGTPTGTASIVVDDTSENTILVTLGANHCICADDLTRHVSTIASSDALLVQLELPLNVVEWGMHIAHQAGIPILLDPAPAKKIPDKFLEIAEIVTPNSQETEMLTGIAPDTDDDALQAADVLHKRGARQVVIKRGAAGCLVSINGRREFLNGRIVEAVDTVGAGDCFAGALIVRWLESHDLGAACRFANLASSLKVQRHGAQEGIPARREVDALL